MRVLLDECVPHELRHAFPGHEVHTVAWAGFRSKKNGVLLSAAEEAGYEVLVTTDQSIRWQQNLSGRVIAIIAIRARTNQMDDLLPFAPDVAEALSKIVPGQAIEIG